MTPNIGNQGKEGGIIEPEGIEMKRDRAKIPRLIEEKNNGSMIIACPWMNGGRQGERIRQERTMNKKMV
jgi:hypothetical protein